MLVWLSSVMAIVNDNVNFLLVSEIKHFGNFFSIIFGGFNHKLCQILSALVKVGSKIIAFIIRENKILVLHPVLPEIT